MNWRGPGGLQVWLIHSCFDFINYLLVCVLVFSFRLRLNSLLCAAWKKRTPLRCHISVQNTVHVLLPRSSNAEAEDLTSSAALCLSGAGVFLQGVPWCRSRRDDTGEHMSSRGRPAVTTLTPTHSSITWKLHWPSCWIPVICLGSSAITSQVNVTSCLSSRWVSKLAFSLTTCEIFAPISLSILSMSRQTTPPPFWTIPPTSR